MKVYQALLVIEILSLKYQDYKIVLDNQKVERKINQVGEMILQRKSKMLIITTKNDYFSKNT